MSNSYPIPLCGPFAEPPISTVDEAFIERVRAATAKYENVLRVASQFDASEIAIQNYRKQCEKRVAVAEANAAVLVLQQPNMRSAGANHHQQQQNNNNNNNNIINTTSNGNAALQQNASFAFASSQFSLSAAGGGGGIATSFSDLGAAGGGVGGTSFHRVNSTNNIIHHHHHQNRSNSNIPLAQNLTPTSAALQSRSRQRIARLSLLAAEGPTSGASYKRIVKGIAAQHIAEPLSFNVLEHSNAAATTTANAIGNSSAAAAGGGPLYGGGANSSGFTVIDAKAGVIDAVVRETNRMNREKTIAKAAAGVLNNQQQQQYDATTNETSSLLKKQENSGGVDDGNSGGGSKPPTAVLGSGILQGTSSAFASDGKGGEANPANNRRVSGPTATIVDGGRHQQQQQLSSQQLASLTVPSTPTPRNRAERLRPVCTVQQLLLQQNGFSEASPSSLASHLASPSSSASSTLTNPNHPLYKQRLLSTIDTRLFVDGTANTAYQLEGGFFIPVKSRRLVKQNILASRAVMCAQHPSLIVPDVLLVDCNVPDVFGGLQTGGGPSPSSSFSVGGGRRSSSPSSSSSTAARNNTTAKNLANRKFHVHLNGSTTPLTRYINNSSNATTPSHGTLGGISGCGIVNNTTSSSGKSGSGGDFDYQYPFAQHRAHHHNQQQQNHSPSRRKDSDDAFKTNNNKKNSSTAAAAAETSKPNNKFGGKTFTSPSAKCTALLLENDKNAESGMSSTGMVLSDTDEFEDNGDDDGFTSKMGAHNNNNHSHNDSPSLQAQLQKEAEEARAAAQKAALRRRFNTYIPPSSVLIADSRHYGGSFGAAPPSLLTNTSIGGSGGGAAPNSPVISNAAFGQNMAAAAAANAISGKHNQQNNNLNSSSSSGGGGLELYPGGWLGADVPLDDPMVAPIVDTIATEMNVLLAGGGATSATKEMTAAAVVGQRAINAVLAAQNNSSNASSYGSSSSPLTLLPYYPRDPIPPMRLSITKRYTMPTTSAAGSGGDVTAAGSPMGSPRIFGSGGGAGNNNPPLSSTMGSSNSLNPDSLEAGREHIQNLLTAATNQLSKVTAATNINNSTTFVVMRDASALMPVMFPFIPTSFEDMLLHRFRPEFVRDYHIPLLPSACFQHCPIGSQETFVLDCFNATLFFFNTTIPTCAAALEAFPEAGKDLCDRLHMFGINLRYLGWLIPFLSNDVAICYIYTEIAARAYRHIERQKEAERIHRERKFVRRQRRAEDRVLRERHLKYLTRLEEHRKKKRIARRMMAQLFSSSGSGGGSATTGDDGTANNYGTDEDSYAAAMMGPEAAGAITARGGASVVVDSGIGEDANADTNGAAAPTVNPTATTTTTTTTTTTAPLPVFSTPNGPSPSSSSGAAAQPSKFFVSNNSFGGGGSTSQSPLNYEDDPEDYHENDDDDFNTSSDEDDEENDDLQRLADGGVAGFGGEGDDTESEDGGIITRQALAASYAKKLQQQQQARKNSQQSGGGNSNATTPMRAQMNRNGGAGQRIASSSRGGAAAADEGEAEEEDTTSSEDDSEDDDANDDDLDIETNFDMLTKAAFATFFPPHLKIPLPKVSPLGLELLKRLDVRYGVVPDTIEVIDSIAMKKQKRAAKTTMRKHSGEHHHHSHNTAANDDDDNDDEPRHPLCCGIDGIADGFDFSKLPPMPSSPSTFSATRNSAKAHEFDAIHGKKSGGGGGYLSIDEDDDNNTTHHNNNTDNCIGGAFEYPSLITPDMIDGSILQDRIGTLCPQLKRIALPGKISSASREHYIQRCSLASLAVYQEYLKEALIARSAHVGERSPRLVPLLIALAEIAARMNPFETAISGGGESTFVGRSLSSARRFNDDDGGGANDESGGAVLYLRSAQRILKPIAVSCDPTVVQQQHQHHVSAADFAAAAAAGGNTAAASSFYSNSNARQHRRLVNVQQTLLEQQQHQHQAMNKTNNNGNNLSSQQQSALQQQPPNSISHLILSGSAITQIPTRQQQLFLQLRHRDDTNIPFVMIRMRLAQLFMLFEDSEAAKEECLAAIRVASASFSSSSGNGVANNNASASSSFSTDPKSHRSAASATAAQQLLSTVSNLLLLSSVTMGSSTSSHHPHQQQQQQVCANVSTVKASMLWLLYSIMSEEADNAYYFGGGGGGGGEGKGSDENAADEQKKGGEGEEDDQLDDDELYSGGHHHSSPPPLPPRTMTEMESSILATCYSLIRQKLPPTHYFRRMVEGVISELIALQQALIYTFNQQQQQQQLQQQQSSNSSSPPSRAGTKMMTKREASNNRTPIGPDGRAMVVMNVNEAQRAILPLTSLLPPNSTMIIGASSRAGGSGGGIAAGGGAGPLFGGGGAIFSSSSFTMMMHVPAMTRYLAIGLSLPLIELLKDQHIALLAQHTEVIGGIGGAPSSSKYVGERCNFITVSPIEGPFSIIGSSGGGGGGDHWQQHDDDEQQSLMTTPFGGFMMATGGNASSSPSSSSSPLSPSTAAAAAAEFKSVISSSNSIHHHPDAAPSSPIFKISNRHQATPSGDSNSNHGKALRMFDVIDSFLNSGGGGDASSSPSAAVTATQGNTVGLLGPTFQKSPSAGSDMLLLTMETMGKSTLIAELVRRLVSGIPLTPHSNAADDYLKKGPADVAGPSAAESAPGGLARHNTALNLLSNAAAGRSNSSNNLKNSAARQQNSSISNPPTRNELLSQLDSNFNTVKKSKRSLATSNSTTTTASPPPPLRQQIPVCDLIPIIVRPLNTVTIIADRQGHCFSSTSSSSPSATSWATPLRRPFSNDGGLMNATTTTMASNNNNNNNKMFGASEQIEEVLPSLMAAAMVQLSTTTTSADSHNSTFAGAATAAAVGGRGGGTAAAIRHLSTAARGYHEKQFSGVLSTGDGTQSSSSGGNNNNARPLPTICKTIEDVFALCDPPIPPSLVPELQRNPKTLLILELSSRTLAPRQVDLLWASILYIVSTQWHNKVIIVASSAFLSLPLTGDILSNGGGGGGGGSSPQQQQHQRGAMMAVAELIESKLRMEKLGTTMTNTQQHQRQQHKYDETTQQQQHHQLLLRTEISSRGVRTPLGVAPRTVRGRLTKRLIHFESAPLLRSDVVKTIIKRVSQGLSAAYNLIVSKGSERLHIERMKALDDEGMATSSSSAAQQQQQSALYFMSGAAIVGVNPLSANAIAANSNVMMSNDSFGGCGGGMGTPTNGSFAMFGGGGGGNTFSESENNPFTTNEEFSAFSSDVATTGDDGPNGTSDDTNENANRRKKAAAAVASATLALRDSAQMPPFPLIVAFVERLVDSELLRFGNGKKSSSGGGAFSFSSSSMMAATDSATSPACFTAPAVLSLICDALSDPALCAALIQFPTTFDHLLKPLDVATDALLSNIQSTTMTTTTNSTTCMGDGNSSGCGGVSGTVLLGTIITAKSPPPPPSAPTAAAADGTTNDSSSNTQNAKTNGGGKPAAGGVKSVGFTVKPTSPPPSTDGSAPTAKKAIGSGLLGLLGSPSSTAAPTASSNLSGNINALHLGAVDVLDAVLYQFMLREPSAATRCEAIFFACEVAMRIADTGGFSVTLDSSATAANVVNPFNKKFSISASGLENAAMAAAAAKRQVVVQKNSLLSLAGKCARYAHCLPMRLSFVMSDNEEGTNINNGNSSSSSPSSSSNTAGNDRNNNRSEKMKSKHHLLLRAEFTHPIFQSYFRSLKLVLETTPLSMTWATAAARSLFNDAMIVREKQKLGTVNEHRKSVFTGGVAEVAKGRRSFMGPAINVTFVGVGGGAASNLSGSGGRGALHLALPGGGGGVSGGMSAAVSDSPSSLSPTRRRQSVAKGGASDHFAMNAISITNPNNETFDATMAMASSGNNRGGGGGNQSTFNKSILKASSYGNGGGGSGTSFSGPSGTGGGGMNSPTSNNSATSSPTRRNLSGMGMKSLKFPRRSRSPSGFVANSPTAASSNSPRSPRGGNKGTATTASSSSAASATAEVTPKTNKKRQLQLLLRTAALFAKAPQRSMTGTEWLCLNNIAFETDQTMLNFLSSRLLSLDSLQATFRKHISTKRTQFNTFTSNVVTLFSLSGLSLSGVNLRGVDMSNVRLDGVCMFGADLRQTRWNHASAVLTNFDCADFTVAQGTVVTEPASTTASLLQMVHDDENGLRGILPSESLASHVDPTQLLLLGGNGCGAIGQNDTVTIFDGNSRDNFTTDLLLLDSHKPSSSGPMAASNTNIGGGGGAGVGLSSPASPIKNTAAATNSIGTGGKVNFTALAASFASPEKRLANKMLLPSLSPAMEQQLSAASTNPIATCFCYEPESPDIVAIGTDQGHVIIFDLATCQIKQRSRQPQIAMPIKQLAYNIDGDRLLSYSSDKIYLWRTVPNLVIECVLTQNTNSGVVDNTAISYFAAKKKTLAASTSPPNYGPIVAAHFGMDSTFIVATTAFGAILLWRLSDPASSSHQQNDTAAFSSANGGGTPSRLLPPLSTNGLLTEGNNSNNNNDNFSPLRSPFGKSTTTAVAQTSSSAASTAITTPTLTSAPIAKLLYSHSCPIVGATYDPLVNQCILLDNQKRVTVREIAKNVTLRSFAVTKEASFESSLSSHHHNQYGAANNVNTSSHNPQSQKNDSSAADSSASPILGKTAMALTPSGTRIAVTTSYADITLFDMNTSEALYNLRLDGGGGGNSSSKPMGSPHHSSFSVRDSAHSISFSPNETFMVAAEGERWYLWHVPKGKLMFCFDASDDSLLRVVTPKILVHSTATTANAQSATIGGGGGAPSSSASTLLAPVRRITSVGFDCFTMSITFSLVGSPLVHALPLLYCLSPMKFQSVVQRMATEERERREGAEDVIPAAAFAAAAASSAAATSGGAAGVMAAVGGSFRNLKRSGSNTNSFNNNKTSGGDGKRGSVADPLLAPPTMTNKNNNATSSVASANAFVEPDETAFITMGDDNHTIVTVSRRGVVCAHDSVTGRKVFSTAIPHPPLPDPSATPLNNTTTSAGAIAAAAVASSTISPAAAAAAMAPSYDPSLSFAAVSFVTKCFSGRIGVVRDSTAYLVSYVGAGIVTCTIPKKKIATGCFFAPPSTVSSSSSTSAADTIPLYSSTAPTKSTATVTKGASSSTSPAAAPRSLSPMVPSLASKLMMSAKKKNAADGGKSPRNGGGLKNAGDDHNTTNEGGVGGAEEEEEEDEDAIAERKRRLAAIESKRTFAAAREPAKNGTIFIASTGDRQMRLWRAHTGQFLATITRDTPVINLSCVAGMPYVVAITGFLSSRNVMIELIQPKVIIPATSSPTAGVGGGAAGAGGGGGPLSKNAGNVIPPIYGIQKATAAANVSGGGKVNNNNGGTAALSPKMSPKLGDTLFGSGGGADPANRDQQQSIVEGGALDDDDIAKAIHSNTALGAGAGAGDATAAVKDLPTFAGVAGGDSNTGNNAGNMLTLMSSSTTNLHHQNNNNPQERSFNARSIVTSIMSSGRFGAGVVKSEDNSSRGGADVILSPREAAGNFSGSTRRALVALMAARISSGCGADGLGPLAYIQQQQQNSPLPAAAAAAPLNGNNKNGPTTTAASGQKDNAEASAFLSRSQLLQQQQNAHLSSQLPLGAVLPRIEHLMAQYVVPFMTTTITAEVVDVIGPIRLPPAESTIKTALSSDGVLMAIGYDKHVYTWNLKTNKCLWGGELPAPPPLPPQPSSSSSFNIALAGNNSNHLPHHQPPSPLLQAAGPPSLLGPSSSSAAPAANQSHTSSPTGGIMIGGVLRRRESVSPTLIAASAHIGVPVLIMDNGHDDQRAGNKNRKIKGSYNTRRDGGAAANSDEDDDENGVFSLTATGDEVAAPSSDFASASASPSKRRTSLIAASAFGNNTTSNQKMTTLSEVIGIGRSALATNNTNNNNGASSSSSTAIATIAAAINHYNNNGNRIASLDLSCNNYESAFLTISTVGQYTEVIHLLSGTKIVRMNPPSSCATHIRQQRGVGRGTTTAVSSDVVTIEEGEVESTFINPNNTIASCAVDDYTLVLLSSSGSPRAKKNGGGGVGHLQSWSLRGLHCRLHNKHPISMLTPPQLAAWLDSFNITHPWLRAKMRHLAGSDLMGESSPSALLVKLVKMGQSPSSSPTATTDESSGGRPSLVGSFGGRRMTGGGGGGNSAAAGMRGNSLSSAAAAHRASLQLTDVTTTAAIGGRRDTLPSEIELPSDDPSLKRQCKKLLKLMSDVAKSSYHTMNITAVDDGELTRERFSEFSTELLVEFAAHVFPFDVPQLMHLTRAKAELALKRQQEAEEELLLQRAAAAASDGGGEQLPTANNNGSGRTTRTSSNVHLRRQKSSGDDENSVQTANAMPHQHQRSGSNLSNNSSSLVGDTNNSNSFGRGRSISPNLTSATATVAQQQQQHRTLSSSSLQGVAAASCFPASMPQQPALAVIFQREHCTGKDILIMRNVEQLAQLGSIDYLGLTFALHGEVSLIRSRDTFSARNVQEVVGWAFSKRPDVRLACLLAGLNGRELLEHLDFNYRMLVPCAGCGQLITDPLMRCPPRRRDHSDLKPSLEGKALAKSTNFAALLRSKHVEECVGFMRKLEALPSAVFSQGLYWHKIKGDSGYAATVAFEVPKSLIKADSLQINSAQLSIFGTNPSGHLPMMAVLAENPHKQTFEILTGLRTEVVRGGRTTAASTVATAAVTAPGGEVALLASAIVVDTAAPPPSSDASNSNKVGNHSSPLSPIVTTKVPSQPITVEGLDGTQVEIHPSLEMMLPPRWSRGLRPVAATTTASTATQRSGLLSGYISSGDENDDGDDRNNTDNDLLETTTAIGGVQHSSSSPLKRRSSFTNVSGGRTKAGGGGALNTSATASTTSPSSSSSALELHYICGSAGDSSLVPSVAVPTAGNASQQQKSLTAPPLMSAASAAPSLAQKHHPTLTTRHLRPLAHAPYVTTRRPFDPSSDVYQQVSDGGNNNHNNNNGGGGDILSLSFTSTTAVNPTLLSTMTIGGANNTLLLGGSSNATGIDLLAASAVGGGNSGSGDHTQSTTAAGSPLGPSSHELKQKQREEREKEKAIQNVLSQLGLGVNPLKSSSSSAGASVASFASRPLPHHVIAPKKKDFDDDDDDEEEDEDNGNPQSHHQSQKQQQMLGAGNGRKHREKLLHHQQQIIGSAEIVDIVRPLWTSEMQQIRHQQQQRRASVAANGGLRRRASSVAVASSATNYLMLLAGNGGGGASVNPSSSRQSFSIRGGGGNYDYDLGGSRRSVSATSFIGLQPPTSTERKMSTMSNLSMSNLPPPMYSDSPSSSATINTTALFSHPTSESTAFIRLLIVADRIPPTFTDADLAKNLSSKFQSKRPQLSVNYCYTDRLCHCHTEATPLVMDPPIPQTAMTTTTDSAADAPTGTAQSVRTASPGVNNNKSSAVAATNAATIVSNLKRTSPTATTVGSTNSPPQQSVKIVTTHHNHQQQQQQSASFYKGLILCDRYCSQDSRCHGHKCIRSVIQHKRAPYLVWQSNMNTATSMRNALLNNNGNSNNNNVGSAASSYYSTVGSGTITSPSVMLTTNPMTTATISNNHHRHQHPPHDCCDPVSGRCKGTLIGCLNQIDGGLRNRREHHTAQSSAAAATAAAGDISSSQPMMISGSSTTTTPQRQLPQVRGGGTTTTMATTMTGQSRSAELVGTSHHHSGLQPLRSSMAAGAGGGGTSSHLLNPISGGGGSGSAPPTMTAARGATSKNYLESASVLPTNRKR